MTPEKIRSAFIEELTNIAPDLDAADITDDDHLQDDLELDSMDILNLVTALHERLGVAIMEAEYRRIETPGQAVAFLMERLS